MFYSRFLFVNFCWRGFRLQCGISFLDDERRMFRRNIQLTRNTTSEMRKCNCMHTENRYRDHNGCKPENVKRGENKSHPAILVQYKRRGRVNKYSAVANHLYTRCGKNVIFLPRPHKKRFPIVRFDMKIWSRKQK